MRQHRYETRMKRIVVIGATGSGKTTLAFNVAARLNLPYTDLDNLHWRPGWQPAPDEEFRNDVQKVADQNQWIVTGNYTRIRDILWNRADTLIWLDYSFPKTLWRLSSRTVKRLIDKQPVCNGNRETLSNIFSDNGIIPWLVKTYRPRRQEYHAIFNDPAAYSHVKKIRLQTQAETERFLGSLLCD